MRCALRALLPRSGAGCAALGAGERHRRKTELGAAIETWTSVRFASEAMERLIALRVPAHQILNTIEAWNDPQLAASGIFG